jgi:hypothetical protein
MMKYPGMEHYIAETNGIIFVGRQSLFDHLSYRLTPNKATLIVFWRKTVMPITKINNRPKGSSQLFMIVILQGYLIVV